MDIVVARTAEELKISKQKVNAVQKIVFKSVGEVFKMGAYNHILLHGFGKFVVKPKRKEYIFNLREKNDKRIQSE